ncbi:phosphatase PAP2 family protein [Peribacillus sp. SCS-37]|uniref:phosphatase PAP2 family protein n=1 Tax=Paraperibacillus esterisolvens TaxID=3115296 RepID=UPI003906930C
MNKFLQNADRTALTFAGFLFVSFITLAILGYLVHAGSPLGIDTGSRSLLQSLEGKGSSRFFTIVTELGSKNVLAFGTVMLLAFLWLAAKDYLAMLAAAVAIGGGDQLNKLAKAIMARERPSLDAAVDGVGYSFPSGHAMVGFIFYFIAAYFLVKNMKGAGRTAVWIAAWALILLIGASRIYFNVHYASDVLGGYALGFITVAVVLHCYEWFRKSMDRKKSGAAKQEAL